MFAYYLEKIFNFIILTIGGFAGFLALAFIFNLFLLLVFAFFFKLVSWLVSFFSGRHKAPHVHAVGQTPCD